MSHHLRSRADWISEKFYIQKTQRRSYWKENLAATVSTGSETAKVKGQTPSVSAAIGLFLSRVTQMCTSQRLCPAGYWRLVTRLTKCVPHKGSALQATGVSWRDWPETDTFRFKFFYDFAAWGSLGEYHLFSYFIYTKSINLLVFVFITTTASSPVFLISQYQAYSTTHVTPE